MQGGFLSGWLHLSFPVEHCTSRRDPARQGEAAPRWHLSSTTTFQACTAAPQASVSPFSVAAFERAKHDHELQVGRGDLAVRMGAVVASLLMPSNHACWLPPHAMHAACAFSLPAPQPSGLPRVLCYAVHPLLFCLQPWCCSPPASTGCTWTTATWGLAATTAGAPQVGI